MAEAYSWEARWIDPSTRLPARIGREGFASAEAARQDALKRAPRVAVIAVFGLDGTALEIFAREPRRVAHPSPARVPEDAQRPEP